MGSWGEKRKKRGFFRDWNTDRKTSLLPSIRNTPEFQSKPGSHHERSSLVSSKLVGPGMRDGVQTDGAQVPTGWGLGCCGRLRAWRSRRTAALLLHTRTNTGNEGGGCRHGQTAMQRSDMEDKHTSVTATRLLTIDIKHVSLSSISSSSSSSAKGGLGGASNRSGGGGRGGGGR